jgi:hypothetical protein
MSSHDAPHDGAEGNEPQQGPAWTAPETVECGWPKPDGSYPLRFPAEYQHAGGGAVPPTWGPAATAGPLRPDPEEHNTRMRVTVTIAALVATVGAIVLGFVLTNNHGSNNTNGNTAAGKPNVAIDPPSYGPAGAVPSGSPTATLSVPPAPPTLSQAQAMASAQAAEKAFAPPTSVPGDVPGYSGSAALDAITLPPFLTLQVPSVQAKDQQAQSMADQFSLMLKAWAEAWAAGNTADARYDTLCADQCRAVLDPTVTLWKRANIVPAGTLRFFNLAGGLAKGNNQSGEAGVCVDDSALTAFRTGQTYINPYPLHQPELLVFGLVYDKAVGHWVATEAYASLGDSYCAQDTGSAS